MKSLLLLLASAITLTSSCVTEPSPSSTQPTQSSPTSLPKEPLLPLSPQAYILMTMEVCLSKPELLLLGKNQLLAEQIERIAAKRLGDIPIAKQFFPVLICIESAFDPGQRSPVGAIGLTQVMPQFAKEFGQACGISGISGADLLDNEVNLTIGACRFGALVKHFKGNVGLALAAYNAGRDAPGVRKLAAGGDTGIMETNGYLAKAFVFNYKLKEAAATSGLTFQHGGSR